MNTILTMTEGAARMASTDPHGWTLTLIAVSVVFSALVILFFIFTLVGKISMGIEKRKAEPRKKSGGNEAEVAAAIALALEAEQGTEVQVAVCTALALYLGQGGVHDTESGIITIAHRASAWNAPQHNFRKNPVK